MSQPLDQMVYGWSETGLEGRNRLQMVATSEGWRQDSKYRRVALRLCRLDARADRDPIAFGWADIGGRRYAFQRRMVANATGDARRLVAHVIAGSPLDLPVGRLLRSFDSSFWWDGRPLPALLPAADPALIGSTEAPLPPPHPASGALLSRILAAGPGSVAFEGGARELHAALCWIHGHVPRLLETHSCSTFEAGSMTGWFDIVGTDGGARPKSSLWCPRNSVEPTYDSQQLAQLRSVIDTSAQVLSDRTPESTRTYREMLRVAERIIAGAPRAVPSLLGRADTLGVALTTELGVRSVAQTLWMVEQHDWPRLRVTDQAELDHVSRLAIRTADLARPKAEVTLGIVTRRLYAISPRTGPVFVQRILQRRSEGAAMPAADGDFLAVAAAWVAGATDLPRHIFTTLVGWLREELGGPILLDSRLPETWRSRLFSEAIRRDRLDIEDFVDLARRYPQLYDDVAWLPEDREVVGRLVGTEQPLRGFAATAVVARWEPDPTAALAQDLHRRGNSAGALALLSALDGRRQATLDAEHSSAVLKVLADLALGSTTGRIATDLLELPWGVVRHLDPGAVPQHWARAAARIIDNGRESPSDRRRSWVSAIPGPSGTARESMLQLALHDLALTSPAGWAFTSEFEKLPRGVLSSHVRARVMLTALARRERVTEPFLPILALALRECVHRSGLLRLRVTLGEYEELATRQVARQVEADANRLSGSRAQLDRKVLRWLKQAGWLGQPAHRSTAG